MKLEVIATKVGLASFTIIMVVGNGLFIPIMPSIQDELYLTAGQTSFLLSVFSYAGALMIPVSGWLASYIGRRNVVIFSLVGLVLGCVVASLAGFTNNPDYAYAAILIGRILQGLGAGAAAPMGFILASELYQKTEQGKMFSFLEVINGFSKALSPALGGFIVAYYWQLGFVWYMAIALIALVAAITLLPNQLEKGSTHSNMKIRFYWRGLLPILTTGFLIMFLLYGLLFVLSSMISHAANRSLFISLPLAILVIMSYLYGRTPLLSFKQLQHILRGGMIVLIIAVGIASFGYISIVYVATSACLVGLAAGVMLPASTSALLHVVPDELRDKALSWLSMIRFLGVASGPIVFAIWSSEWKENVVYLLGITGSAGIILFISNQEKEDFYTTKGT